MSGRSEVIEGNEQARDTTFKMLCATSYMGLLSDSSPSFVVRR